LLTGHGFEENRILGMVRFVFTVEDLGRTRFAISPMWELVLSLVALRDPSYAALHVPWLRSLSGRLSGLELERAIALNPPRGYSPDFVVPTPSGPLGSIADDLAALRSTPISQIRADMTLFAHEHRSGRRLADAWLAHPRREVRRLADLLEAYWDRALAAVWPRIGAFLDADTAPAPESLGRLLGTTRAVVLADVAAPRSTTELARRLSLSAATVSHHLSALRDAGLVTARRAGRTVLYVRTPLGDALVDR
jgi:DNA-binding transcriptional ArsR family regulator